MLPILCFQVRSFSMFYSLFYQAKFTKINGVLTFYINIHKPKDAPIKILTVNYFWKRTKKIRLIYLPNHVISVSYRNSKKGLQVLGLVVLGPCITMVASMLVVEWTMSWTDSEWTKTTILVVQWIYRSTILQQKLDHWQVYLRNLQFPKQWVCKSADII